MDDSCGLTVSVSVHGQDAIVEASGELDLATAPELEAALDEPSPEGGRVILDLRHLRFSDAQGLHSIERASRRLGPRLISLYRFEGRRLIGVATFDRQEDALAAHRLAHP